MSDQQRITMAEYNSAYLAMLERKYGGEATLNELRVMNHVFRSELAGVDVGVAQTSRALGIPKSTVSRIVLKLRLAGWISEQAAPDDGRRRFLRLTPKLWHRFDGELQELLRYWPQAA